MHGFLIFLLVVFAVCLVLFFPISFHFLIYSNLIENANFVYVQFLGIFSICKKVNFQNKKIILTSTNGKTKELELKLLPPFVNNFFKFLFLQVKIDFAELYSVFGISTDAGKTAYFSALWQIIISEINVVLSMKKNVVIKHKFSTNYNEDKLNISLNTKLNLTIFDVILVFVKALVKTIGESYGKKRKPNKSANS